MNKNEKWLITVDLDGTLLNSPKGSYPNYSINDENIKELKKVIKAGHKVAIVTGRPWRDTKDIYENIGLKTIVANYNGAYIHHPNDKGFIPAKFAMNRNIIMEMINNSDLKKVTMNMLIEYEDFSQIIDDQDEKMMEQFHITKNPKVQTCKLNQEIEEDPYSVTFRINPEKINPNRLLVILKRQYGNSFLFRYWTNWEKTMVNLEVNQKASTKGYAMRYIAAYYNISSKNTICFGDGLNDIEMLSEASVGVAMSNAKGIVKSYAADVTDYSNDQGGVGKYLNNFFKEL
ncbi:MAG: Cof-type HAD-IIB family hydrolase [Mycoplasmataceae bacterium]|nr:Cof-type HAD-IIB family hydrolase [Mycoplasmataceae bacterium]